MKCSRCGKPACGHLSTILKEPLCMGCINDYSLASLKKHREERANRPNILDSVPIVRSDNNTKIGKTIIIEIDETKQLPIIKQVTKNINACEIYPIWKMGNKKMLIEDYFIKIFRVYKKEEVNLNRR